jgi:hypothetical protein
VRASKAWWLENRQSLAEYEESAQVFRNTRRQISQKQHDYELALEQQQATSTALRRREQALDEAIDRLGISKASTEARMRELEAAERDRVSRSAAATGGREASRGYEMELAQDHISSRGRRSHLREEVHGATQGVGQGPRVRPGLVHPRCRPEGRVEPRPKRGALKRRRYGRDAVPAIDVGDL